MTERIEETGPEWRSFQDEGEADRSRVGSPISLRKHDLGLSTMIGTSSEDASGRGLSLVARSMIERLRTWNKRSQLRTSTDQNLRRALQLIVTIAEKMGIKDDDPVVERASYIYRKALQKGLTKGRPMPSMTAAALYLALRDTGTVRNLKDVAAVSGVKRKDLAKHYRLLLRELDVKVPTLDPIKCVPRIANRAGLSGRTVRRAIEILKKAREMRIIEGKDPMGLASAALYIANLIEKEGKNQRDLAQAAGVTEVTIRNRCKGFRVLDLDHLQPSTQDKAEAAVATT
jgi:transcription initiation factor TFIIB